MRGPFNVMLRWWKDGNGNGHDDGHGNGHDVAVAGANGNGHAKLASPDQPEATQLEPPWLPQADREDIPRTLRCPSTTLGGMLDQAAARFGHNPALIYNHK